MESFTKEAGSQWSYSTGRRGHLIKWNQDLCNPSTFSNMLVAKYALRESVQRKEMLQDKIRSLEKAAAIEPKGKVQLAKANSELDRDQIQVYRNQQALYRAEVRLLPRVKEDYEKLRSDEDWYMREEMVQDCADKGGCCSRGC
ncbi:hypothetical protein N7488_001912 [Penicillium malachiteum]|nr:hypothetical protein N7488_001912 [Penicillium malachiteum]